MSDNADFIIEIGTEELPPKALNKLMLAFGENLNANIDSSSIKHGNIKTFASPRRLAVLIEKLANKQSDKKIEHKGPPLNIAFDENGMIRYPNVTFSPFEGTFKLLPEA